MGRISLYLRPELQGHRYQSQCVRAWDVAKDERWPLLVTYSVAASAGMWPAAQYKCQEFTFTSRQNDQ